MHSLTVACIEARDVRPYVANPDREQNPTGLDGFATAQADCEQLAGLVGGGLDDAIDEARAELLTFAAAMSQQEILLSTPFVRSGWIFLHITLIFIGYAALFLSFAASLLYLIQERTLKAKQPSGILGRLPALQTIDEIGYRSLLLGFPFMTLGLMAGSVVAQSKYGAMYFHDPKIVLSLLMWAVYVVLLYTRWSSGWRGRRAAYLATCAFAAAVIAWAANYFSAVHGFVSP